MTNTPLQINFKDLIDIKKTHPHELDVILEMLAEAGENSYVAEEMEAFEFQSETTWLQKILS